MAGFTEGALEKKLGELTNSQQCIQTLSLWLIHHRKHYQTIVKVWYGQLCKVPQDRKLTFLYLANDVIQNSKKKGPEFRNEFGHVLMKVFSHIGQISDLDPKTTSGIGRLVNIWDERGVYEPDEIAVFKARLVHSNNEPPKKKSKKEKENREIVKKSKLSVVEDVKIMTPPSSETPPADPPEPEELIKALQDLEQAASTDEATRAKLVNLPPEVTDPTLLGKLRDRQTAEHLCAQVNNAATMLSEYNQRLQDELQQRKDLLQMLHDFTQAQRALIELAEERLAEFKEQLDRVHEVKEELVCHLDALPDLTQLPDFDSGLRPLPSAGDLFSHS